LVTVDNDVELKPRGVAWILELSFIYPSSIDPILLVVLVVMGDSMRLVAFRQEVGSKRIIFCRV
jgi:hypothetical protein